MEFPISGLYQTQEVPGVVTRSRSIARKASTDSRDASLSSSKRSKEASSPLKGQTRRQEAPGVVTRSRSIAQKASTNSRVASLSSGKLGPLARTAQRNARKAAPPAVSAASKSRTPFCHLAGFDSSEE